MHALTEDGGFYAQLPDHERQNFFQQRGAACHTSRHRVARVHEAGFKWDTLYMCIHNWETSLKSEIQHNVTWSPRRLCYRPTVFSSSTFVSSPYSFPQGKIRCAFRNPYYVIVSFWNCVSVNLCKWGSVRIKLHGAPIPEDCSLCTDCARALTSAFIPE
jgi:hypothetical protein